MKKKQSKSDQGLISINGGAMRQVAGSIVEEYTMPVSQIQLLERQVDLSKVKDPHIPIQSRPHKIL